MSHQEKKNGKHINSLQSLNDAIHWSSSTLNVPSGEKTETHQFSPILERCHPLEFFNSKCPIRRKKRKHINSLQSLNDAIHWSSSTLNVPSGEKTETHQFSPILERCHPLEFFNSKCPIRKKRKHINSQSLNERCHPLESFNSKCPIRRKNGNTSILSILERCHPLEFFNSKCPIRRKKRNDAIHWSSILSGENKTHP
ncbi:hypothetical protein TNCV_3940421 [Trichonephila clavipes]|uniref:Uncharacterized protein n=1 Tax=Trichonephila clavipes TaxID=2585209 RepID=A0A8X6VVU5_TRICX|nr:hypothetical protein TNCV_3940421 [Trichonephila clavipes]